MVEYTLVLEIGQSNASPIGDIQGWEDNHPELAFRSPGIARSQAKPYSTGAYRDDFTLAATFKGGPQVDTDGAVISGDWQTVNLRGVASDAVRVATFYNPIGTLQTFSAYARSWPGTYNVVGTSNLLVPNTSREFATNFLIQPSGRSRTVTGVDGATVNTTAGSAGVFIEDAIVVFAAGAVSDLGLPSNGPYRITSSTASSFDIETWPQGEPVNVSPATTGQTVFCYKVNDLAAPIKLTRKRTGSTHTYAPTGVGQAGGARLVVDPPFTPAAVDNEEFSVDLRITHDSADASDPLVFESCFGGLVQTVPQLSGAVTECSERFASSSGRALLHSPAAPLRQGRPVNMTYDDIGSPLIGAVTHNTSTISDGTSGSQSAEDLLTGSADTLLSVGDALVITDAGSLFPSELTDGGVYYVVEVGDDYFQIATSPTGTAIAFGAVSLPTPDIINLNYSALTRWPTRQPLAALADVLTNTQGFSNVLGIAVAQDFVVGEKVRVTYVTGDGPTGLPAGDYYVQAVDATSVPTTELLSLESAVGGGALSFTWDDELPRVERLDAYTMWYVSTTRDGADATGTAGMSRDVSWTEKDRFAGSISGLRIRCTSGANIGQWKHGKHVSYDLPNDLCKVHFDGSWSTTPARGDVFVIEPTPVGDQERPYEKFCQLLPWSPFEGQARGSRSTGLPTVTINHTDTSAEIVPIGLSAPDRTSVKFYTTGTLPNGLTTGKTYYSTQASGAAFFIAETYNGTTMMQNNEAGSGTHYAETVDNDNGDNPFPPGFNYPSQFSQPRRYMPFDGYVQGSFYGEQTSDTAAGISAGVQLSFDLHSYTGRRTLYVPCTFGGTSIGHKEVHPTGDANTFGWSDLNQQISWAPGEDNGCFARLLDVLDGVKLALTEEGSTIKDVVVHFNQGEEDARIEYLSGTYRKNLHQLKNAVRQALYDRGLSPVKAERIKWLHATIKEISNWPYASTVNAAITAETLSDPYSRSLVGSDLEVHADRPAMSKNPDADAVHYHGTQMDLLGQRAFAAFKALERSGYSETEVCNMALSYLGEPGRLTNVDTDTSREAELCRQFLPLARDELLERHAWDFALRSVAPTKRSASPRVDYKYAYDYPDGVASVLGLVRSDVDYNYKTMGTTGQHDYTVELDDNGDRVLLTDLDDALMLYVAKVTDPTKWSTVFTTALAWRLVFHIAGAILKGEEGSKKAMAASQMAEAALRTATKHDSDHKRDVDISDHVPVWLRHRSNPGHYRR